MNYMNLYSWNGLELLWIVDCCSPRSIYKSQFRVVMKLICCRFYDLWKEYDDCGSFCLMKYIFYKLHWELINNTVLV
jgi:hypothetical protein